MVRKEWLNLNGPFVGGDMVNANVPVPTCAAKVEPFFADHLWTGIFAMSILRRDIFGPPRLERAGGRLPLSGLEINCCQHEQQDRLAGAKGPAGWAASGSHNNNCSATNVPLSFSF